MASGTNVLQDSAINLNYSKSYYEQIDKERNTSTSPVDVYYNSGETECTEKKRNMNFNSPNVFRRQIELKKQFNVQRSSANINPYSGEDSLTQNRQ